MTELKKGDKAPDFKGIDQYGQELWLSSLLGKKIILYFYPKDDTPGCTAEACNLRDNYSGLTTQGFVVIGVSPDNQRSHQKFITKYELPFILISDTEASILRTYNAWGQKSMYGKTYDGVLRKTYIIDEQGVIISIIDKVDTGNHTQQILDILNK